MRWKLRHVSQPLDSKYTRQEVTMKPGYKALLFITTLLFTTVLQAQSGAYRARLSPMPVNPQTVKTITGGGEVSVTLTGNKLVVTGSFSGMSSAATMAHLHNGPPAQPGPVVQQLQVTAAPEGTVSAELELTPEQVTALQANSLYIQIHSSTNPAGELRGWIFPRS
jgi:hypothetical protein